MTEETLKTLADMTGLEPFAIIKGATLNEGQIVEEVYVAYMGEFTLMASFYLYSDALKYAIDLATRKPMWKVFQVGCAGVAQRINPEVTA